MSNYRFYLLREDGMVATARIHALADDRSAIAFARAIGHANGVEVWQQARQVGVIPAAQPAGRRASR